MLPRPSFPRTHAAAEAEPLFLLPQGSSQNHKPPNSNNLTRCAHSLTGSRFDQPHFRTRSATNSLCTGTPPLILTWSTASKGITEVVETPLVFLTSS